MLSIIIPVYNAEKTIKRCLNSIFDDCPAFPLEVIAINDGSSDNSLQFLNSFRDTVEKNLRVISQFNQGVSNARNRGIEEARGEWTMFVDADDFLEAGWSKVVEKNMLKENKFVAFASENIVNKKFEEIIEMITGIYSEGYLSCIWSKLYLTEILKKEKIRFCPEIINGEDIIFNLEYFLKVQNVTFQNATIYNYSKNTTSATSSFNPKFLSSDIEYQDKLQTLLKIIAKESLMYIQKVSILNAWLVFFNRYSYQPSYNKDDWNILKENEMYLETLARYKEYRNYFPKFKRLLLYLLCHQKYRTVFNIFKIKNNLKHTKKTIIIERI